MGHSSSHLKKQRIDASAAVNNVGAHARVRNVKRPTEPLVVAEVDEQGHRDSNKNNMALPQCQLGEALVPTREYIVSSNVNNNTAHQGDVHIEQLNESIIADWNITIQCQRVIDSAVQKLHRIQAQWGDRRDITYEEALPEGWKEMLIQKKAALYALRSANDIITEPRKRIYGHWQDILGSKNLVTTTRQDSDYGREYNANKLEKGDIEQLELYFGVKVAMRRDNVQEPATEIQGETVMAESCVQDLIAHEGFSTQSMSIQEHDDGSEIGSSNFQHASEHSSALSSIRPDRNSVRWIARNDLKILRGEYKDAKYSAADWEASAHRQRYDFIKNETNMRYSFTLSEFDRRVFKISRDVIRRLVDAEEKLEKAHKHALEVGVLVFEDDQESGFADYPEDNYRLSAEVEAAAHSVNRDGIVKWVNNLGEQSDKPTYPEADSVWDVKTLDIEDTFSIYADGKERKRIDVWKAKCDETRASLPVELKNFTVLEDGRIEAASQAYGRFRSFSCSN